MARIVDRASICWIDKDGKQIKEDIFTYDDNAPPTEEEQHRKTKSSYQYIHMESESIEKKFLVLVIDEMLDKLDILRMAVQDQGQHVAFKFPEYKTPEERFAEHKKFYLHPKWKSSKRYDDLTLIYSTLFQTLEELVTTGTYTALGKGIEMMRKRNEDDKKLKNERLQNRRKLEEHKQTLKARKKDLDAKYKRNLEEVHNLELECEKRISYGKMEYNYVKNWEEARRHQATMILDKGENKINEEIAYYQNQIKMEKRIHRELMKFYEQNAEELTHDIDYWTNRYESEVELRDSELLKLRMNTDAEEEKLMELKTTHAKQKQFIDEWNAKNEQMELEEELKAKKKMAAIKIQQWWRAIMKKRKIGPYKKTGKAKAKVKGKGIGKKKI